LFVFGEMSLPNENSIAALRALPVTKQFKLLMRCICCMYVLVSSPVGGVGGVRDGLRVLHYGPLFILY